MACIKIKLPVVKRLHAELDAGKRLHADLCSHSLQTVDPLEREHPGRNLLHRPSRAEWWHPLLGHLSLPSLCLRADTRTHTPPLSAPCCPRILSNRGHPGGVPGGNSMLRVWALFLAELSAQMPASPFGHKENVPKMPGSGRAAARPCEGASCRLYTSRSLSNTQGRRQLVAAP